MKKLLAVVVAAFAAGSVRADVLDLNGSDTTVTSLKAYTAVQNSGEPATLTVNLTSGDEKFEGTISGPVKLVKKGFGKMLSLSGNNTYTGGTQIDEGWLQALSTTAFGDKTSGPIQVNSECTVNAAQGKITALVVGVDTFDYDINFATWSDHGGRPVCTAEGTGSMYNLCAGAGLFPEIGETTNKGTITFNGKITGGDLSIREARNVWGNVWKMSNITINGDIELDAGGAFYLVNRCCPCYVYGKVTAGNLMLSNANTPSSINLYNTDNSFASVDTGRFSSGGVVSCNAVNAIRGAKIISTAALSATSYVELNGNSQIIDAPTMTTDSKSTTMYPGVQQPYNANTSRHNIHNSGNAVTLTMQGSDNATNDWLLTGKISLVWDPQGDYELKNVYRGNTNEGSLVVKDGTFTIGEACSFTKLTEVTLENDAKLKVVEANAIAGKNGALQLMLSGDSTIELDADWTWEVYSVVHGTQILPVGTYTADDLDWLSGNGRLKVQFEHAGADTGIWKGGAANDNINNHDNWDGLHPTLAGTAEVSFTNGTSATINTMTDFKKITMATAEDFTFQKSGDNTLTVGAGGIAIADHSAVQHRTEIKAPLVITANQDWRIGQWDTLRITGGLSGSATATFYGDYNGRVLIVPPAGGNEGFTGEIHLKSWLPAGLPTSSYRCGTLYLQGVNPLGSNGKLHLTGVPGSCSGTGPNVILQSAQLGGDVSISGHYKSTITSDKESTNVIQGAISPSSLDFAPDFVVAANSQLTINGDVALSGIGYRAPSMLLTIKSNAADGLQNTASIVFNGKLQNRWETVMGSDFGDIWFNAAGNTMVMLSAQYIDNKAWYSCNWHMGADDAFGGGTVAFVPAEGAGKTTVIDLHGHSQYIGTLGAGNANTLIKNSAPDTLADFRVNQTSDVTFAGKISTGVKLVKDGAGTMTFANANAFDVGSRRGGVLALMAGKVKAPAEGLRVRQLKYYDADGAEQFVDPGTYEAATAPETIKGFFAEGSGPIKVHQGEGPNGAMLFLK